MSIETTCKINPGFVRRVEKKEKAALYRIGAYVRGVARRKIRVVKDRRKHGQPGQPWKAHDQKSKNAIAFNVDEAKNAVQVGLTRLDNGVTNEQGQPVSQVLEHGGIPAAIVNPFWRRRKQLRDAYISSGDMVQAVMAVYQTSKNATYYRAAPAFWGTSKEQALQARAKANKKTFANMRYGHASRKGGYSIYAWQLNKRVWVAPIKLTSQKQARKVASTITKLQGYPVKKGKRQAARPLMRISLKDAQPKINQLVGQIV